MWRESIAMRRCRAYRKGERYFSAWCLYLMQSLRAPGLCLCFVMGAEQVVVLLYTCFLLQKYCGHKQSLWWCPVSFQVLRGQEFPSLWGKAAWPHVQEPGLLAYCEVFFLYVVLISIYSSGSLAPWADKDWLCL